MALPEHCKYQRFITSYDLPVGTGPDGKKLCAWCDKPLGKGRRRYCSEVCSNEFLIRSSGQWAAHFVYQRDKAICALCKLDCDEVSKERSRLLHCPVHEYYYGSDRELRYYERDSRGNAISREEFEKRKAAWEVERKAFADKYPGVFSSNHHWEADHIIPVAEGGGSCGLDNLRTLCKSCHAKESGALRKRINKRFKENPIQAGIYRCGYDFVRIYRHTDGRRWFWIHVDIHHSGRVVDAHRFGQEVGAVMWLQIMEHRVDAPIIRRHIWGERMQLPLCLVCGNVRNATSDERECKGPTRMRPVEVMAELA